eukprot:TRINITY_DN11542_c0_g1_i1.p2 TRINITY_DN11542_c0_g1~~TRINITY_DN11542_c0_g1_i1.p2  ORF type:complete len:223 (+),score=37.97 TRINITY_DN11542_c0_g1_i1:26-670(+)
MALAKETIVNCMIIIWNVLSSLSCIFLNKVVFTRLNWPHGTALTTVHFYCTFLCLLVASSCGMFPVKKLKLSSVIGLSIAFALFIVSMNLSLRYNSVGFYQVSKVMDTPFVYGIEYFFYNVDYCWQIRLSLVTVMVGVLVVTTSEGMYTSVLGSVFALVGVVSASFYQIWVGTKQKSLSATSNQLLLYQAPLSAVLLTLSLPVTEGVTDLWPAK